MQEADQLLIAALDTMPAVETSDFVAVETIDFAAVETNKFAAVQGALAQGANPNCMSQTLDYADDYVRPHDCAAPCSLHNAAT